MRKYKSIKKHRKLRQILALFIMFALAVTPIFIAEASQYDFDMAADNSFPPPLTVTLTPAELEMLTVTDNNIPPPLFVFEYTTEFIEIYEADETYDEINEDDDTPVDFALTEEIDGEDVPVIDSATSELETDNTDDDLLNSEDDVALLYANKYIVQIEPSKPLMEMIPTTEEELPTTSEEPETETTEPTTTEVETTEIETSTETVTEPTEETTTELMTELAPIPTEPVIVMAISAVEPRVKPTAEIIEFTIESANIVPLANFPADSSETDETAEEEPPADNIFYEIMPEDLIPLNNGWFAKDLGDGLYEIFDNNCAPLGIVEINDGESIEDWDDYDNFIPLANTTPDDTTEKVPDLPIPSPQTGDNIHIILGLWILMAAGLSIFKKK
jgi:hypothetical protein